MEQLKNVKKLLALVLALAMCVTLFAACSSSDDTTDTTTNTGDQQTAQTGDNTASDASTETGSGETTGDSDEDVVIVIGVPSTWNQLDCLYPASAYHIEVSEKIYDRLARLNEAGEAEPRAAESWELSDDMKTITFHLRDNSYFHDGVQVTSADWRWTIEMMTGVGGSNVVIQDKYVCIEGTDDSGRLIDGETLGIETPDDYTLVVHLKNAMTVDSFFYNYGWLWYVLPSHLLSDLDQNDIVNWDFWQSPIGSGPCKFVSQDAGATEITLDAVDNYPVGDLQFDRLIFRVVTTDAAASAFMAGEINLYYYGYTKDGIAALDGVDGLSFVMMDNISSFSLVAVNNERFDSNFRKAVNLAIDKDLICESLYNGDADATNTSVRQSSEYCQNSWTGRDVEAAKELLAASNYDGSTISFACSSGRGEQTAAIIQQNLAEIGITLDISTVDTATTLSGLTDGTYDMGICNYTSGGSPTWLTTANIFGLNVGHIDTTEYYELSQKVGLSTDTNEIAELATEYQTLCD
jgi:peptide/nickel transport system substrate-binding protein